MRELRQPEMPEIKVHEYSPLLDSSDMGPCDWARLAVDIKEVRGPNPRKLTLAASLSARN